MHPRTSRIAALAFLLCWPHHALATAAPQLTPQLLVGRVIQSSTSAKEIQLLKERSEAMALGAAAPHDWLLSSTAAHSKNRGQSPGGFSSDQEKTQSLSIDLQRQFTTGTAIKLAANHLTYDATYPATLPLSGGKTYSQSLTLEVKQDLWRNGFGGAMNARINATILNIANTADEMRTAYEDLALRVLSIYWQAWSLSLSIDSLKEAVQRSDEMLRYSKERSRFGLGEIGELARVEADRQLAQQQLRTAESSLKQLVTYVAVLIDIPVPEKVDGILPGKLTLADRPTTSGAAAESSLALRMAKRQIEAAQAELTAAESDARPELALFAKGALVGVDPEAGEASSEMLGADRPNTSIGLSFSMPLGNYGAKALIKERRANLLRSEYNLERTQDDIATKDRTLVERAQVAWDNARNSEQIILLRENAVEEMRGAFRQGRLGLDQVTLASNMLTAAQVESFNLYSQYFIARDELNRHRYSLISFYVPEAAKLDRAGR